ncbi:RE1 [Symbiodinium sp. CCMP2456]|nr:RE1 [Symbiodinium sp. CCMP2456]
MSLDKKTKGALVELLREHGEEPPTRWTKVELRQRLIELNPSLDKTISKEAKMTELQQWVGKINRASVKKANLVQLCQDELQLTLSGNETVATLEKLAMQRASVLAKPMAQDYVGFGKHAGLEYQDINEFQPAYREWVLKTDAEETGCDYRLRRLAVWLRENPVRKGSQRDLPVRGQPKSKAMFRPSGATGSTTPPATEMSPSAPSVVDRDMIAILQNLAGTVQDLQQEMAELKGERPRKKDQKTTKSVSDTTSEGYTKDYEALGDLSAGRASQLEQQSWEIVGCEPNSFLTTAVQDLIGSVEAAKRLSTWNGANLGTSEGVKLILQQVCFSQPGFVWLTTPDSAFSPMQHSNSRTDAQKEDLQRKRAVARKTFEGAAIVYRYCIQQGIHCAWVMSEKSDAWRLPLLQNLIRQYQAQQAVTHGCRVGLRSMEDNRTVKKGWKLITSHARNAKDRLPYQNGSEKGGELQIFDQASGIQGDPTPKAPQVQDVVPENLQHETYAAEELQEAEDLAKQLLRQKDFSEASCLQLIHRMPMKAHPSRTGQLGPEKVQYHVFGAYAYGAQFGVSNRTEQMKQCVKYLNAFMKAHARDHRRWTSMVLSVNNKLPLHRDVNNEANQPNMVLGLGSYSGGELWVQETIQAREMGIATSEERPLTKKTTPHGEDVWGRECLGVFAVGGDQASRDKETEKIKKQLYLLHAATGHCSTKHLVTALKRRNARPEVIKLASEFRCSICEERQKLMPRHLASLEPLPPKFHTISADVGHWTHPETQEQHQFLVVIDEGSRFRVARMVSKGPKQQPSGATCVQYLREGWAQIFGNPRTLRLDPAGSFRSQAILDFCDRHQIFLDLVPGEAHWKIGVCEQAVQGLKSVMDKVCRAEGTLTAEEALSTAVRIFNQRDLVRGYSPVQHVLGQAPDETGRIDVATPNLPPELLVENPGTEFAQAVARRTEAEKAHAEWNARQRLVRAANSRSRRVMDYQPGELVYFWRQQHSGKNRQGPQSKKGVFMGPARILATEKKRNPDGTLQDGSIVWCVRGRQLIKCCVEQLRRASPREELVETLSTQDNTPWVFTKVAEQIGGNQFEDVSQDNPQLEEWWRAQNPEEEIQPARRRITEKRSAPPRVPDDSEEELVPDQEMSHPPVQRAVASRRARRSTPYAAEGLGSGEHWCDRVPEEAWFCQEQAYWCDPQAGVQVEVEMPQTGKGWKQALQNFEGYMVGAMKRRAIEVREKHLSDEERLQFEGAKAIEVKNFVAARAFEALPESLRPSKEQAIHMRWILTWKQREDGTMKAKARAVLLGFQDPGYAHRSTTAPVMSRQSRQLLLQQAARRKWSVFKGDVSGAFLQGRDYPGVLHCVPCNEICDALGVPRDSIMRLRKACYGLVDAPLEWYRSVAEFLAELGLERSYSDPCTWLWRVDGCLRGMISGHVDDFLFGGSDEDSEWQGILKRIKDRFQWGDWERDTEGFTQCGVRVLRTAEGFELSQAQFVEALKEIPLNAARKRERREQTSEREKTQLRALLGSLSWLAQQTAPHLSAPVSLLLSEVSQSTVDTIVRTNQLAWQAKQRKNHSMLIHAFDEDEPLAMFAWVDAGSTNRPDGGSTQGIFVGIGPQSVLQDAVGRITPVAWHSSKVERICRSPGAAEAQAAVNGEDTLFFSRYQWGELEFGDVDSRDAERTVNQVVGCLVTDSRNVYDKLNTEVLTIKGAEKRTDLEMLGLKEAQCNTGLHIRWVHSEAQLTNSLTKAAGGREMELYYQMRHQWRIVEDPQMRSARRRRQEGIAPLTTDQGDERNI